ncbi:MAG: hypothetical protein HKP58_09050 [Desulfatitalea sp.]|nr:hypothetical protein [Desulfatitalea sp.]NNK00547.1 hypothetical protein [Desulfatitalea sp.]
MVAESLIPDAQILFKEALSIMRMDMDCYPVTNSLGHTIVEGQRNKDNEIIIINIHTWEVAPGGSIHRTFAVLNKHLPEAALMANAFSAENMDVISQHPEYEAARWTVFLPQLYDLWKDHPDPTQNVTCDLRVRKNAQGKWEYIAKNGPVCVG